MKTYLDPTLLTPKIDRQLAETASYFPAGEPTSIKLIGARTVEFSGSSQANITFEYAFDKEWAVAEVFVVKTNGKLLIKGLHISRLSVPLEKIYAFNFSGKSPLHYLFLFFAVVLPLFTIYAIVLCVKTPMAKRKWLWIIFILMGIGSVAINWTTGKIFLQLASMHMLSAGAVASSPYSPWFISISFPLGAIVFLVKRKALTRPVEFSQPDISISE